MNTTSTTSVALTLAEAMAIAELAEQLRSAETRLSKRSHHSAATPDEIRGCSRLAEAISSARDLLSGVLITAEVYAECDNAKRAREAF